MIKQFLLWLEPALPYVGMPVALVLLGGLIILILVLWDMHRGK
jgi:hypothetical protein